MRFKLLCFFIPLKVAFVITLQYLAINISDTLWISWLPTFVQDKERWLSWEWACVWAAGTQSSVYYEGQFWKRVFWNRSKCGEGQRVPPGARMMSVPGLSLILSITGQQIRASEFSVAKGKYQIQWPLRSCLVLRLCYSIINDQYEEQSPSIMALTLRKFGC